MRLIPSSFNGFLFQQTNRVASDWQVAYDWTIAGIGTNNIQRSQNFPAYAAKSYTGNVKVITVNMTDVDSDRDPLVIAMDIFGGNQHQLISKDQFGRSWYVNAICIGLNEEGASDTTSTFGAVFEIDDPVWKKLEPSTATINVSGTGTGTLTTIGNQQALPTIEITPVAGSGDGFQFQRFIQVINNSANALTSLPLNLTGAGLDTAAMIADNSNKCKVNVVGGIDDSVATIPYDTVTGTIPSSGLIYCGTEQIKYTGKTATNFTGCTRGVNGTTAAAHADDAVIYVSHIAADGNDVRIYVDGVEVKRWFYGINTANTKIWINWTQPANSDMTLGADIAGAGDVATITIENTSGNVTNIALIPTTGNVLIGSEIFVYTGVNVAGLQLTGCTRASRQTSAGAHTTGDAIKFVTHDVYMYYGYVDITPYVVDDTNKPIIKLTSTNTSWIFEEFGDGLSMTGGGNAGLRTGTWYKLTPNTYVYYSKTGYGNPVDPWECVGIQATTGFGFYHPCGITEVTASGQKYKKTSSYAWATITFEKSADGIAYTVVWTEAAPSSTNTWEALSAHTAVSLSGTYYYIKIVGTNFGAAPLYSAHEFDDVTLTIDTTLVPTITIADEFGVYPLNATLTNTTTGESMTVALVTETGKALTIDTAEKTVTLYDGSNQINAIDTPVRAEWFRLLPGANAISITEAGIIQVVFTWEDRTL